jgi:MFS transporter, PAT family, beta-lactamase induction signal transducer AmpG
LWRRPYIGAVLLLIVSYKLADAFAFSLNTVFYLREMGFTLTQLGFTNKTMSLAGTLIGIGIGGIGMARWGLYPALWRFGILQTLGNGLYLLLMWVGKNYYMFASTIFVENLTSGMGTAAFVALLMSLCKRSYTATQFALLSSVGIIARVFIPPFAGLVVSYQGWVTFFVLSMLLGLPSLWLLIWLKKRWHFTQLNAEYGTEGRNRTDTVLPPPDFESGASTSSATPAR